VCQYPQIDRIQDANFAARRGEEEFKLLSLFEAAYTPNTGLKYKCSFRISHHNLYFVFDEPQLGPDGMCIIEAL
jgi:hypothetical protein